ncbi:MAG: hypothetical protein WAO71_07435 [Gallionella sp.]
MNKIYWLSGLGLLGITAAIVVFTQFLQPHYYPLLQIKFPDQAILTFVDTPWATQEKCQSKNEKMLTELRTRCPSCQISINRCEPSLAEPWQSVLQENSSQYDVVHSGSLRIVVDMPQGAVATCEAMAAQIRQDQKTPAHCLHASRVH